MEALLAIGRRADRMATSAPKYCIVKQVARIIEV
jgi:hypothetical protein